MLELLINFFFLAGERKSLITTKALPFSFFLSFIIFSLVLLFIIYVCHIFLGTAHIPGRAAPKSQVGFAGLPAHVVLVGSAFKVYCKHMDGCLHIPDAQKALGKWGGEEKKEGEVRGVEGE